MIKVNRDLSIEISHEDILDIPFKVNGLTIAEEAEIYFAVKKTLSDEEECIILRQCNSIDRETNTVRVVIETDEMAKLLPGKYYYELIYKFGEKNRRTLNFPTRLVVWGVVHDERK